MQRAVVLDLDSTLLYTFSIPGDVPMKMSELTQEERDRIYVLDIQPRSLKTPNYVMWGVLRKGLEKLILLCQEHFDYIVVWSAGERMYVERLVEKIFSRYETPCIVLTRDDLEGELAKHRKPLRITADIIGLHDTDNIVIIDDNAGATREDSYNCITIPPFTGKSLRELLDKEDDELDKTIEFILSIMEKGESFKGDHMLDLYPHLSSARLRNVSYEMSTKG